VAGWPKIERADDQQLAESLVSGDEAATARIYDVYAARLFDYCHVLLRDQEAAALALLNSLIIVQERAGELPDLRLFRGWLYAVTRGECGRLRADAPAPAERRRAPEASGGETDEETRRLVHAALLVLNGRQRGALDLSIRHELDPHELSEVLRTTPQDASVLVAHARQDLDAAFVAMVVATSGRADCPSVSALAGPPGPPMDAETCGKLARHAASCPICRVHGDRRVDADRLLTVMPFAAIPGPLRERVLTMATDPQFAAMRSAIAMRAQAAADAEPDEEGRQAGHRRRATRRWPAIVGVAAGVLVIGGIFFVLPGSSDRKSGNDQAISSYPSDMPSAGDSGEPLPSDGAPAPSPTPSTSSGTPTPTPTKTPTPTPTPTHTKKPHPPVPPPPPAPGTLVVYGCTMHGSRSCTITVVAQGGPVSWSVVGVRGGISSGGGGSLAAGQSAGVTVTRNATFCIGSGSGSVSFSSGASAPVTYYC
jgi:DNA-directed RNA polymerase specialized sigma24 family protein